MRANLRVDVDAIEVDAVEPQLEQPVERGGIYVVVQRAAVVVAEDGTLPAFLAEADDAVALPARVLLQQPVGGFLAHVLLVEIAGAIVLGLADRQVGDDEPPASVGLALEARHLLGGEADIAAQSRGGIHHQQVEGAFVATLHTLHQLLIDFAIAH